MIFFILNQTARIYCNTILKRFNHTYYIMTKEFIDNYAGQRVKLTMINDAIFEGLLWFVNFKDEKGMEVHSISLDTYKFQFRPKHIKNIEIRI